MKSRTLFSVIALLAGCSTPGLAREDAQLADYRAHAGAPVESFRTTGRILSWTPLGDDAVAVWTAANQAWLLELDAPCPALDFARAIQLSDSVGRVSARFDRVTPIGGGPTASCRIEQIRPLDIAAIREARRARRSGG